MPLFVLIYLHFRDAFNARLTFSALPRLRRARAGHDFGLRCLFGLTSRLPLPRPFESMNTQLLVALLIFSQASQCTEPRSISQSPALLPRYFHEMLSLELFLEVFIFGAFEYYYWLNLFRLALTRHAYFALAISPGRFLDR